MVQIKNIGLQKANAYHKSSRKFVYLWFVYGAAKNCLHSMHLFLSIRSRFGLHIWTRNRNMNINDLLLFWEAVSKFWESLHHTCWAWLDKGLRDWVIMVWPSNTHKSVVFFWVCTQFLCKFARGVGVLVMSAVEHINYCGTGVLSWAL